MISTRLKKVFMILPQLQKNDNIVSIATVDEDVFKTEDDAQGVAVITVTMTSFYDRGI